MSPDSVQLGIEEWMNECLSLLRRIADEMANLRPEMAIDNMHVVDPSQRQLLTVEETARLLGIGRTATHEAARSGQIPSLRLGRRVLIPRSALMSLLSGQPTHGG